MQISSGGLSFLQMRLNWIALGTWMFLLFGAERKKGFTPINTVPIVKHGDRTIMLAQVNLDLGHGVMKKDHYVDILKDNVNNSAASLAFRDGLFL